MRAERSGSQILHGFLPGQTVDLHGGVWKVDEWLTPRFVSVDTDALRREIVRLARPWEVTSKDNGFVRKMREERSLRVHALDRQNGVRVQQFPRLWQCRVCKRVGGSPVNDCRCGAKNWGQLHFVAYHECGHLDQPWIPRCQTHNDVRIIFPGSSDARQIRFECPTCNRQLQKGFGFRKCSNCDDGTISFNVHRAASVFTPRSVVVVNAATEEQRDRLRLAGGAERALAWVVGGMPAGGLAAAVFDRQALVDDLVAKGIDPATAGRMADVASSDGEVEEDGDLGHLGDNHRVALDQAVTIYNATAGSRTTIDDLIAATGAEEHLGQLYRVRYVEAIRRAGLESVELLEQFPVLTGYFGYTRGDQEPGKSSLGTWRDRKTTSFVVYGELQQTEAMFFRLSPQVVTNWLERRGHVLGSPQTDRAARLAVLGAADVPAPGDEVGHPTVGSELLRLLHSMSHRVIRQAAVIGGVERTSLAELLVPNHLGFFVFAAARGDFVLGGLQALFETELDRLLDQFVLGEHRCALDPGCTKSGGACVACLHLGEPSCRYFNRHLDRRTLFGAGGYLS